MRRHKIILIKPYCCDNDNYIRGLKRGREGALLGGIPCMAGAAYDGFFTCRAEPCLPFGMAVGVGDGNQIAQPDPEKIAPLGGREMRQPIGAYRGAD